MVDLGANIKMRIGPSGRDTIVIFDPSIIDSDEIDLSFFMQNFVRKEGLFRFRINPERVKITKSKLTASVLTKAGFERAYLGNNLTMLSYSGNTGRIWLPQSFQNSNYYDMRWSPVWQKFIQLEEFFESLDRDVMLLDHRGTLYRGCATTFNYGEDANRPFDISYNLTFEAYTDSLSGERLGAAIQRMGKWEELHKDYIASMTYRALLRALGSTRAVSEFPGREGITSAISVVTPGA